MTGNSVRLDFFMSLIIRSKDALLSLSGNVFFNTRRVTTPGSSLTFDGPESLSSDSPILFS
jgi:hypothetical protein